MAYAPHTNTDVHHQLQMGIIPTPHPLILGCFTETEHGKLFEYAERRWPDDDFHPELPHVIYVVGGETRLANVLKTVAYVLTDEDELRKWNIKQHRNYDTSWVR